MSALTPTSNRSPVVTPLSVYEIDAAVVVCVPVPPLTCVNGRRAGAGRGRNADPRRLAMRLASGAWTDFGAKIGMLEIQELVRN